MSRHRVVIDDNVYISAVLDGAGPASTAVRHAFGCCVVLHSLAQRVSLTAALSDHSLRTILSPFDVRDLEDAIVAAAEYSEFPAFPFDTGNYAVDFARAANADFLVTEDHVALALASERMKPHIVDPADFLRDVTLV